MLCPYEVRPTPFSLPSTHKPQNQYWNWGRYADDPVNSPLFNGNSTSMSGNGAKYDYEGYPLSLYTAPYNLIPPAEGGGCVTDGPFVK